MNPIIANAEGGTNFKVVPWRSKDFLAMVRRFPCAWCGRPGPSDPHHHGPRGIGQKADDFRTIPLCRGCHRAYHDGFNPEIDDEWQASQQFRMIHSYLLELEE